MSKAIIGYSGFVGRNLMNQFTFDGLYNSKNISEIRGKEFDLLICAGVSAVKWKANKYPEEDLNSINILIENIKNVKTKKFILISTIDVYKNPVLDVNEDTFIESEQLEPYGKNRFYFEQFIRQNFNDSLIVRLPGLFGEGLKKNFIFDMINNNCLDFTDKDSFFQFYCLELLWRDIERALENNFNLVNFSTEPIRCEELARECFNMEFRNKTEKAPAFYNMKSKYAHLYNGDNGYLYNKVEVISQLKEYLQTLKEYKNEDCNI